MSQQSGDASPVSDSATPEESSNPNRILKAVPLRTISSDEVKATKPKMPHTKRPKESIHNKGAKPSSSNTLEELTKEGTKYVDKAITKIATRILKENHQVSGIFVPLQTIMSDPIKNTSKSEVAHTSGCDPAEEEINKDGQGIAEDTNVTEDVNDIEDTEHTKVNTETGTNVVVLDEYSDKDLLVSQNPSVANRLMTRRKGKVVSQSSPKKSAQVKSPVKDAVKKKSTSTGPIKSRAMTKSTMCYEKLIKEFVASRSVDFRKVFVRGKCVSFSPFVINKFLGRADEAQPEIEVTDNKVCQVITAKQVNSWPLKEKLTASKLSIKYAMLHKIGVANWVPTNHKSTISTVLGRFLYVVGTKEKFDYGTYIFDQTMKHVGSFSVKGPNAFPSLLCGIILTQYPNILNEHDVVCKRESPLAFHYKFFQGTHVPDIVMTSAKTSKSGASVSKAEVIAMLKETCKELEARKISLEKMISTLEMDDNKEFVDAVKMAEDVEEWSTSPTDGSENRSYADTSSGSDSGQ
ncbi:uncharacterized protein LOC131597493 [Vicia villosa]|uniref:uncharacterized protein LOC131597493 n=1 Tax=Vicia villosa TaxID=3911 RepID=UPI00273BF75C|nr:uncharacterized protein LOC131597493 [Vicia villosa]